MPIFPLVARFDILKKLLIEPARIFAARLHATFKTHVVGMCVEKSHTATSCHPIQFVFPNVNRFFLKDDKQIKILSQCVWKLNITRSIVAWYPEWENRVDAVRLRFERIGVESGRIVKNVEVLDPFEVVKHEGGAEPDGVPFLQIPIDRFDP